MKQQHEPLGVYDVSGFDDVVPPGRYNILQASPEGWWMDDPLREVLSLLLEHPSTGDLYHRLELNRGGDSFVSYHRVLIDDDPFPDGDQVFARGAGAHKL